MTATRYPISELVKEVDVNLAIVLMNFFDITSWTHWCHPILMMFREHNITTLEEFIDIKTSPLFDGILLDNLVSPCYRTRMIAVLSHAHYLKRIYGDDYDYSKTTTGMLDQYIIETFDEDDITTYENNKAVIYDEFLSDLNRHTNTHLMDFRMARL